MISLLLGTEVECARGMLAAAPPPGPASAQSPLCEWPCQVRGLSSQGVQWNGLEKGRSEGWTQAFTGPRKEQGAETWPCSHRRSGVIPRQAPVHAPVRTHAPPPNLLPLSFQSWTSSDSLPQPTHASEADSALSLPSSQHRDHFSPLLLPCGLPLQVGHDGRVERPD